MRGAPVYLSAREIERVQGAAGPFEQVAAYGGFTFEWVSPDGSRPWGAPVSPALLRLLGLRRPLAGSSPTRTRVPARTGSCC